MEFLKNIPFIPIALFLFGVFIFNGGMNIVKRGKYYSATKNASSPSWRHFVTTGKEAKRDGIGFIFFGIAIIAFSIFLFSKGD